MAKYGETIINLSINKPLRIVSFGQLHIKKALNLLRCIYLHIEFKILSLISLLF